MPETGKNSPSQSEPVNQKAKTHEKMKPVKTTKLELPKPHKETGKHFQDQFFQNSRS
jgi:hypothetical protein